MNGQSSNTTCYLTPSTSLIALPQMLFVSGRGRAKENNLISCKFNLKYALPYFQTLQSLTPAVIEMQRKNLNFSTMGTEGEGNGISVSAIFGSVFQFFSTKKKKKRRLFGFGVFFGLWLLLYFMLSFGKNIIGFSDLLFDAVFFWFLLGICASSISTVHVFSECVTVVTDHKT